MGKVNKSSKEGSRMVLLEEVIEAAKAEKWDVVDKAVNFSVNRDPPVYFMWAVSKGLKSREANLRDLACTIVQKRKNIDPERYSRIKPVLSEIITKFPNGYEALRAACAMVEHGYDGCEEQVVTTLRNF